jgi:hypothetical protein
LSAQEYNRVTGLEIAKEIWDTLPIAHEGVDKIKKSKINILMAELNRFTIFDGEGPQEMFDRLMVIVGKIRGLGGDELDDHYVVKVMLEAFSPRNPTLVTLIRGRDLRISLQMMFLGEFLLMSLWTRKSNIERRLVS